jgi:acyl carrier protein
MSSSLTKEKIREELLGYFDATFPLFDSEAPDETPLAEHGVDSLGTTNIVVHLEQQYQVEIEDSEITRANLGSLKSLVGFLDKKLNG